MFTNFFNNYDLDKMNSDILKKDYTLFFKIINDKKYISKKYDKYLTNGQYIFRNMKDKFLQYHMIQNFEMDFFYVLIDGIFYYIFLPENIFIEGYKLLFLRSLKILNYFRENYHFYSIRAFLCTESNFELFELYLKNGLNEVPVDILLSYNNYSRKDIFLIMSYINNIKDGKVHEKYQKLLYKNIIKNIIKNDLTCCKDELTYCTNLLMSS